MKVELTPKQAEWLKELMGKDLNDYNDGCECCADDWLNGNETYQLEILEQL